MKVFFTILLSIITLLTNAQAPKKFAFQGQAHNASGDVIANAIISLRLTIHESSAAGTSIYQEKHKPQTNDIGIFTVSIGTGLVQLGVFNNVNWKSGDYFLQVELDASGGENYINLSTSQFLSVPYALHASQSDQWKNDDPIVQTGAIAQGGNLPNIGSGSKLIWYPRRAAFRAGWINSDGRWDSPLLGEYSVAFGRNTIASGFISTALGDGSTASGLLSTAIGLASTASGNVSTAIGNNVQASGYQSLAMGSFTVAKCEQSTSMGTYNNSDDIPGLNPSQSDRIFQIGNGDSNNQRSNALTILRNGYVGLGNSALEPSYILDLGARMRIRHNESSPNGKTAGLFFNDSQQQPNTFVGMKADDQVGMFIGNSWKFWVSSIGEGFLNGNLVQTSDRRLKRDFTALTNSLTQIINIKGYHYYMKDSKTDQSLQTGVIAQEVEEIFPELVKTDKEGMKSVNYIGFIPHLIESVKELKAENENLKKSVNRIDSLEASLHSLIEANKALTLKVEQSTK
jgi:hypothetical protein